MYKQSDLMKVKRSIEKCIGIRVKLESGKKKHACDFKEGVIETAYQSVFIVQLYDSCVPTGRVSYNYIDVLTKTVEITTCE